MDPFPLPGPWAPGEYLWPHDTAQCFALDRCMLACPGRQSHAAVVRGTVGGIDDTPWRGARWAPTEQTTPVLDCNCSTASLFNFIADALYFHIEKEAGAHLAFPLAAELRDARNHRLAGLCRAARLRSATKPPRRVCHVALGQGGKKKQKSELALGLFNNSQRQENLEIPKKNILRLGGRFGHLRQMQNHSWFYDWGD